MLKGLIMDGCVLVTSTPSCLVLVSSRGRSPIVFQWDRQLDDANNWILTDLGALTCVSVEYDQPYHENISSDIQSDQRTQPLFN